MSSWAKIVAEKKVEEKPIENSKPIEFMDDIDYELLDIQNQLHPKIFETYACLVDATKNGMNAFLFCKHEDPMAVRDFFYMVYKNVDYSLYGRGDSNDNVDAESDLSEEYPWENARNRFAYC